MKPSRTRFQLYLPQALARQVEALAREPGVTKSTILEDAVRMWLRSRAGNELDDRLAVRLDRMSRAHEEIDHKLDHLTVAFHTFVQHHLTLTADRPLFDVETARLGRDRFDGFLQAVARKLARSAAPAAVNGESAGAVGSPADAG